MRSRAAAVGRFPRGRCACSRFACAMRPDLPLPPSPEWPALTTSELVARKPDSASFAQLPRAPISVVLEDVRSLANVGLIFRICDALRVERLYLCGITGRPADPIQGNDPRPRHVQERAEREIAKTAVMAIPFVPWEYQPSALVVVGRLRHRATRSWPSSRRITARRTRAPAATARRCA